MDHLLHRSLTLAQNTQAGEAPSKTLLTYIREGGSVGYVIIILSFVAVALIIVHFIRIRVSRLAPAPAVYNLDRLLRDNDVQGALAYCNDQENDCFLTRVFGAALARCARSPFGFLELRSAVEEAGQEELARLHRSNEPIGLIASIAPMLGLLGTVVGMVMAFDTISTTKGMARPDQLAGYISLALVTTVLGLIVAIPVTAVYAYIRNRTDALAAQVAQIIEELSSHVQSVPGATAASAPGERRVAARPGAPTSSGAGVP
jgi:biopolymer transport protein ExbB